MFSPLQRVAAEGENFRWAATTKVAFVSRDCPRTFHCTVPDGERCPQGQQLLHRDSVLRIGTGVKVHGLVAGGHHSSMRQHPSGIKKWSFPEALLCLDFQPHREIHASVLSSDRALAWRCGPTLWADCCEDRKNEGSTYLKLFPQRVRTGLQRIGETTWAWQIRLQSGQGPRLEAMAVGGHTGQTCWNWRAWSPTCVPLLPVRCDRFWGSNAQHLPACSIVLCFKRIPNSNLIPFAVLKPGFHTKRFFNYYKRSFHSLLQDWKHLIWSTRCTRRPTVCTHTMLCWGVMLAILNTYCPCKFAFSLVSIRWLFARTKLWMADANYSHSFRFYPRELAYKQLPHGLPPGETMIREVWSQTHKKRKWNEPYILT